MHILVAVELVRQSIEEAVALHRVSGEVERIVGADLPSPRMLLAYRPLASRMGNSGEFACLRGAMLRVCAGWSRDRRSSGGAGKKKTQAG